MYAEVFFFFVFGLFFYCLTGSAPGSRGWERGHRLLTASPPYNPFASILRSSGERMSILQRSDESSARA